jgi:hypothetical protein
MVNAADRLSTLLSRAKEAGQSRHTARALDIWASALGQQPTAGASLLQAIADADHVVDEVVLQLSFVDHQLLENAGTRLTSLHTAFTFEWLLKPWHSTISQFGNDFDLALSVCLSTLRGRIAERPLTQEQIDFIFAKLEALRSEFTDDLPAALIAYLNSSIDQLELVLNRYWLLGPDYLAKVADSIVGVVGREVARRPHAPAHQVRLLKRLGSIAAGLATAITISLGVIQIDQATINELPWVRPDQEITQCILELPDPGVQIIPAQIQLPSPPTTHK